MAIVTAALWLTLSTATTSPPDPTLVAPAIDPPAPVVVEDASDSIVITESSLWTGLQGDAVSLVLRDGSEAHGTVVAQTTHAIRLARARDGLVVLVIKSDIASIRVHPRPEPEPTPPPNKSRQRLIGGGAFLLTFGGAATLSGATILAIYPEYTFIHLPLLLPGLVMVSSGAAMVAIAPKRKRARDKCSTTAAARPSIVPLAAVGPRAGHVGFTLRF